MKDVTINADATGFGSVVIGGVDISDRVLSVYVHMEPGRTTRVTVEVVGDVSLDAKQADVVIRRQA